jgi:glycosyltransferase involved in cell wall biosynthesis
VRILLVNWAKVWDGPVRGGGVNGYVQSLALALRDRGHEVACLCSGTEDVPAVDQFVGRAIRGECAVRRHDDWLGVKVFEVVNSPVLAPGVFQFKEPLGEIAAPELEAELSRFAAALRPDVVHFHNIEGFSSSCVEAFSRPRENWNGAKLFFSLHNYHTICPQVYLMQEDRVPCFDFESGRACTRCAARLESRFDPGFERERRQKGSLSRLAPPGSALAASLSGGAAESSALAALTQVDSPDAPSRIRRLPFPGAPVRGTEDTSRTQPNPFREIRGTSLSILRQDPPPRDPRELAPLTNDIPPGTNIITEETDFARRRAAMIAMLNRCDGVLAVSEFVRAKFQSLGVRPSILKAITIGARIADLAAAKPELRAAPPPIANDESSPSGISRPVRLVFMGYNNYYKGLPMLLDSLEQVQGGPADSGGASSSPVASSASTSVPLLSRLHLFVYAKDLGADERRLRELEPRMAGLTIRGEYEPEDIPWMLAGKDAGIVPSVWWDNGPQTVMEFLCCGLPVIGASLGGIPDFVTHEHNGLLFRGNDRADLARTLASVLAEPSRLGVLRAQARPTKAMRDHAAELEAVYGSAASAQ